jgi:hypothetical protein
MEATNSLLRATPLLYLHPKKFQLLFHPLKREHQQPLPHLKMLLVNALPKSG